MRALLVAAVAGAVLGIAFVAAPVQAGPGPSTPAEASACAAVPLPGDPRPADEVDDRAQTVADRCVREATGYPLPVAADADARCNDRAFLVPGCAREAVGRCTTRPAGAPPCDPAAGTTVWLNASAFSRYCLDCAPDLDTRARYQGPARHSLAWDLTVGLYHCHGRVANTPGGPGPAPALEAEGSCPPLQMIP